MIIQVKAILVLMVRIQWIALSTLAGLPPAQPLRVPRVWLTTVEDAMPNGLWMEWRSRISAKVSMQVAIPPSDPNVILCTYTALTCIHLMFMYRVPNRRSSLHAVWHCLPSNLWASQPYLLPPVCAWVPVCWRTGAGWRPMHPTRGMWWGIKMHIHNLKSYCTYSLEMSGCCSQLCLHMCWICCNMCQGSFSNSK